MPKLPVHEVQLILPFVVPSENRGEPFTKEMELATLFCLAELERQKGGGIVLKQRPETTAFLSEASYQFILIPWNDQTLVFDTLSTVTHTTTYKTVPDAKEFIESLESRSKTLETFMAFLADNANYFKQPQNEQEIALSGLVADPSFLNEFSTHLDEAKQAASVSTEQIVPSVALNEDMLALAKQEIENLRSRLKEDLDALYAGLKLLGRTAEVFVKALRSNMKALQGEYGDRIGEQEKIATPNVNRIRREYDQRITELSRKFEKQLAPLQKEKVKLEKTAEQTRAKIEQYKTEAKSSSSRKNKAAERRWKEKVGEAKNRLSHLQKEIKETEKRIRETEESKSVEIVNLRSESETRTADARKPILELEAEREAKIGTHKQRMDEIKVSSATLAEQISATAKLCEADLAGLAKLGIQQKRREQTMVCVPFYVVCYQSEKGRRYLVVPPSVANSVGLAVKLKGALGKAKIGQLLSPRFRTIATFLDRLPLQLEQNPVLEREIYEEGKKANLLDKKPIRDQIKSGLEQVKQEGWFSEKEYEAFSQQLA